jgi:asparagine synthase (glutamine-hydrolysing)
LTSEFFKENYFKKYSVSDFEKLFMLTDLKTWLADESLMRTDKMTMAHGLEQRVPVLDHNLVELAYKIPSKYKMKDKKHGKEIFIEAMRKYLPNHVLESEQKKVWLTPMSNWLRSDLNGFAKNVLSAEFCSITNKYFNFKEINLMFSDHINKKKYNLSLIWALINFQVWCRKFI